MAILSNLIVHGASRLLGTCYANDIQISGTAAFASLSTTGNMSVGGTLAVTGATTLSSTLGVTGAATFSSTLTTTGNITSSGNIYAKGGYLYLNNKVAADGGKTTANQLIINGSNSFTAGTYIKNIFTADNLDVSGQITTSYLSVLTNLHAAHYDLQTVAQLGGSFYVSPTLKFPSDSGTRSLKVTKSGNTLTLTITDPQLTSANLAGITWTVNSLVKVSGTINGVVTGTMDGHISAINASGSNHVLTVVVSGENSGSVVANNSYGPTDYSDLSVMVYSRKDGSNDYRVGIWMNCYDMNNSSSTIRIYGGTDANPNVMLGNLTDAGLGTVNNLTPTGWGLFAQNAYLHGTIVAKEGKIGGFSLSETSLYSTNNNPSANNLYIMPTGTQGSTNYTIGGQSANTWVLTAGTTFGVTKAGGVYATSGKIGGWNIGASSLYSGTHSAYNTNVDGIFMDSTYIAGGKEAVWYLKNDGSAKIGEMTLSSDGTLSVPAASIGGTLTASQVTLPQYARNLMINTTAPDVSDPAKIPKLIEQKENTVKSAGDWSTAPHGIRVTSVGAVCPYIRFGGNAASTASLNGLQAGHTYTLSFDAKCKLMSSPTGVANGTTRYLYLYIYDDTTTTGTFALDTSFTVFTIPKASKGTELSTHCDFTFTVPANATMIYFLYRGNLTTTSHYAAGDYVEMSNIMLAESATALNWEPSILDPMPPVTNFITEISNGGIKVHDASNTTDYVQITSDGTQIFKNSAQIANFGGTATIGSTSGQHVVIGNSSFDVYDGTSQTPQASFGSTALIGNMSSGVGFQISATGNDAGMKFNHNGTQAFFVGVNTRYETTTANSSVYTITNSSTKITIEDQYYYYVCDVPSGVEIVGITGYAPEGYINQDDELESTVEDYSDAKYLKWTIQSNKFYAYTAMTDSGWYSWSQGIKYVYLTQSGTAIVEPYCVIGTSGYSGSTNPGINSLAQGNSCFATGKNAVALGSNSKATGNVSLAMGAYTTASGDYSIAMGYLTTASGAYSTAMGYLTTASGAYSTAMGYLTTASGAYSTAMGHRTTASGNSSTAMGYQTTASGSYSTAMGSGTTASGSYSTAMGSTTKAFGRFSTAMGGNSTASGQYSVAMGYQTTASGSYSTTMGRCTVATSFGNTVIGKYNTATRSGSGTTADPYTYSNAGDYAFIIGNGTGDATNQRSNALTVDWDGNTHISGNLTIDGYISSSTVTTGTAVAQYVMTNESYTCKWSKYGRIVFVSGYCKPSVNTHGAALFTGLPPAASTGSIPVQDDYKGANYMDLTADGQLQWSGTQSKYYIRFQFSYLAQS